MSKYRNLGLQKNKLDRIQHANAEVSKCQLCNLHVSSCFIHSLWFEASWGPMCVEFCLHSFVFRLFQLILPSKNKSMLGYRCPSWPRTFSESSSKGQKVQKLLCNQHVKRFFWKMSSLECLAFRSSSWVISFISYQSCFQSIKDWFSLILQSWLQIAILRTLKMFSVWLEKKFSLHWNLTRHLFANLL